MWLISFIVGGASGVLGGVVVNWLLDPGRQADYEPDDFEPDVEVLDADIDQAAAGWAQQHGRPGAESLMADKLRLAAALQRRRRTTPRTRRRWTP